MSEPEPIVRVAAKGDGVTASGRHVPFAAPGDAVGADGVLLPGPHHATPPCRHFPQCGGCQLQHIDEEALAGFVRDRVVNAAQSQALEPEAVASVHLSPPRSRRRATLHAVNGGGRPLIGFREAQSHRVVDMRECHVLAPELFALVEPLRRMLGARRGRYALTIELALTDQGVDCAISGLEIDGLEQTETLLDFCRAQRLARLMLDQGFGPEAIDALVSAAWPGNIRQLYNVVEQAVALSTTPLISPALVQQAIQHQQNEFASFEEARRKFEREYLAQLMRITEGNVTQAARLAKRNRTEFYKLLQRHQLDPKLFKAARV